MRRGAVTDRERRVVATRKGNVTTRGRRETVTKRGTATMRETRRGNTMKTAKFLEPFSRKTLPIIHKIAKAEGHGALFSPPHYSDMQPI